MPIKAIILCKLGINVIKPVIEEIQKIPQIIKVMSLTGDYDVLAEIIVETPEELYEIFANKIDMINGITVSNTHMVMKEFTK
jgi:DNA-binding Lrp family transcriptional regulator